MHLEVQRDILQLRAKNEVLGPGIHAKSEAVSLEADERKSPNNSQFDFNKLWNG